MNKKTKIWLMIASVLVVLGSILFVLTMSINNWDFSKVGTVAYETNSHEVSDEFSEILIDTKITDIKLAPADDENCKVVCFEQKNLKHEVKVENATLTIRTVDSRRNWFDHIGINFKSPAITVYLPAQDYTSLTIKEHTGSVTVAKDFTFDAINISTTTGNVTNFASVSNYLTIKTSTGDIHVDNVTANAVALSVSTGVLRVSNLTVENDFSVNVSTGIAKLTDISCKNFTTKGNTGDLSLKNVIASDQITVERTTGKVMLERCDASKIIITTDTGDVQGTLCSEKIFIAKSDTGTIDVPKTVTGGQCQITTDTGDITISIVLNN